MFIKEVILRVSDISKSILFYSAIFGDAISLSGSRAEFKSGLVLSSEEEWRTETGLQDDFHGDYKPSSTIVFESNELSRTILSIVEHGYMRHMIKVDSDSAMLVDHDCNVLIIRKGGKDEAYADDYSEREKMSNVMSLHSPAIGKKGPFC